MFKDRASVRLIRIGWLALAGTMLLLGGCRKDLPENYEAELEYLQIALQKGSDTVVLLAEFTRADLNTTELRKALPYGTDLSSLAVFYRVSLGATVDSVENGELLDFSAPRTLRVRSQDGAYTRDYVVELGVGDPPPFVADDAGLESGALLSDFRLKDVDAEVTARGTRIVAVVAEDAPLYSLVPEFTISKGASSSVKSGMPFDFSEDVLVVLVSSEDGSSQSIYTIRVQHPAKDLNPAATLESLRFEGHEDAATIIGSRIFATVPKGWDLGKLRPVAAVSKGARLEGLVNNQPGDFSTPRQIKVYSADGKAISIYTLEVEHRKGTEADISYMELEGIGEAADINGSTYTFCSENSSQGATVRLKELELSDGATANWEVSSDITLAESNTPGVTGWEGKLTIGSEDGLHKRVYTIRLMVKWAYFTSFGFKGVPSKVLQVKEGSEGCLYCIVPAGTDISQLTPVYETSKLHVYKGRKAVGANELTSGSSVVNFNEFPHIRNGQLGASIYRIQFLTEISSTPTLPSLRKIKLERVNGGEDIEGAIRGRQIDFGVPRGTPLSALTPVFEVRKGRRVGGIESGVATDFSTGQTLELASEDGSALTQYTITVTERKNDRAELLGLRLEGLQKPEINGSRITFFGGGAVDATQLIPHFSLSPGATIGGLSDGVARDFSQPVQVQVISEDGSITRVYTIVVDKRLNYEAALVSFRFEELADDACTMQGTNIRFEPGNADPGHLTPMFEVSTGASYELVENGVTSDFSKARKLKVTSEDKSMTVTYTIARTSRGLKFDFERWESKFSGDLRYYLPLPSGYWSSANVGLYRAKKLFHRPKEYPVTRSDRNPHGGQYCARMETVELNVAGRPLAAGALYLGSFDAGVALSDPNSAPHFGIAWPVANARPTRFKGWFKYRPGAQMIDEDGNALNASDQPRIRAIFYYGAVLTAKEVGEGSERIVSEAILPSPGSADEWTYFDIPFEARHALVSGQSLNYSIILSPSKDGAQSKGAIGSVLEVDDLEVTLE
ncbi:MAG: hypothetical protein CSA97_02450 [Bacteroidetes bacterium]|nr:MAG: hypothetical protein CSA97_02450 [Bacteroidota bacterium]